MIFRAQNLPNLLQANWPITLKNQGSEKKLEANYITELIKYGIFQCFLLVTSTILFVHPLSIRVVFSWSNWPLSFEIMGQFCALIFHSAPVIWRMVYR